MKMKFRVWNHILKRWRNNCCIEQDGSVWCGGVHIGEEYTQRFTGLLHKNSHEIFEGDIIKIKYYNDISQNAISLKNGSIMYGNQPLIWCLECIFGSDTYTESGLPRKIKEAKIIGNIFENPNLIK